MYRPKTVLLLAEVENDVDSQNKERNDEITTYCVVQNALDDVVVGYNESSTILSLLFVVCWIHLDLCPNT